MLQCLIYIGLYLVISVEAELIKRNHSVSKSCSSSSRPNIGRPNVCSRIVYISACVGLVAVSLSIFCIGVFFISLAVLCRENNATA